MKIIATLIQSIEMDVTRSDLDNEDGVNITKQKCRELLSQQSLEASDFTWIWPAGLNTNQEEMIEMIKSGLIGIDEAKNAFVEALKNGDTFREYILKNNVMSPLEKLCRESISLNPKAESDFKGGKETAINAFKGHVMRVMKGNAQPKEVDDMLRKLLTLPTSNQIIQN